MNLLDYFKTFTDRNKLAAESFTGNVAIPVEKDGVTYYVLFGDLKAWISGVTASAVPSHAANHALQGSDPIIPASLGIYPTAIIESANRLALSQDVAVGKLVKEPDNSVYLLIPGGVASSPGDWITIVSGAEYAPGNGLGGLLETALASVRTISRTAEEGAPEDGDYGTLLVDLSTEGKILITSSTIQEVGISINAPTLTTATVATLDALPARNIVVSIGSIAAMQTSGTIYSSGGLTYPIPQWTLLYAGQIMGKPSYTNTGEQEEYISAVEWDGSKYVLSLADGDWNTGVWYSTAPANPASPNLVETWSAHFGSGTPVVTAINSTAQQVVDAINVADPSYCTVAIPGGTTGLGPMAEYARHVCVMDLGTVASFLSQECIVAEESIYKCVRLLPVKWLGPFGPYSNLSTVTSSTPIEGATVTCLAKVDETLYVTPAAPLNHLEWQLPMSSDARIGQVKIFSSSKTILSLSITVSGGGSLAGASLASAEPQESYTYQCVSTSGAGTWLRLS